MRRVLPLLVGLALPGVGLAQRCSKAQLAALPGRVAKLSPTERTSEVSKVIASACDARLPSRVVDALDSFHVTEVAEHGPAMLMALRDAPAFAEAGCEKWEEEFSSRSAPGDKLRSIHRRCEVDKLSLATEEELAGVADLGAVYVAAPLYAWMVKHGFDATTSRRLVRSLLGLTGDSVKARAEPTKAPGKKKRP